jgi:hypothetical protein
MQPRHVDRNREAKAGGTNLVERDAADLALQLDNAANLVSDLSHRQPCPCPAPKCGS